MPAVLNTHQLTGLPRRQPLHLTISVRFMATKKVATLGVTTFFDDRSDHLIIQRQLQL